MMYYLFPAVGRQVEREDGEEGDAHAGDDDVDGVEESLPPHSDVEGDVQVRLVAARVELLVSANKLSIISVSRTHIST